MTNAPNLRTARAELARRVEHWLELPMAILGGLWLILLSIDLLGGSSPATNTLTNVIWIVFIVEFLFRFVMAPRKRRFLRRSWITALSLGLPALRVLRFARVFRLLRVGRGLRAVRLARLLTSFNRGMRALGATMRSRGFPYVVTLTVIVVLLGATGMYNFEREAGNRAGFSTFSSSLWWTAMLITTMGSEHWPRSPEGRLVCLLLSVYAFAVFGYITATLASYFVGADAERERERAGRLEQEVAAVRALVQQIAARR